MKVEQFVHSNQFRLYGQGKNILQSYNSKVVEIEYVGAGLKITLGRDWDYSTTTSKHVYMFLEEYGNFYIPYGKNKRAYVNKAIKNGEIGYNENMY